MAPPAINTLFFFHQAHLAELRGWSLTTFTAFFPVLSVTGAIAGLSAGSLVDRLGAWRLMPVVLLPLALSCLVLGTLTSVWAILLMFLAMGLTQGMMNPVVGALRVELYGTTHIGAIRSLVIAALTAASTLGPSLAGALIDIGVDLDRQAFGYAGWCVLCAGAYLSLQGALGWRARSLEP